MWYRTRGGQQLQAHRKVTGELEFSRESSSAWRRREVCQSASVSVRQSFLIPAARQLVPKRSLAKPNPTLVCSRHPGIVWSQLELILFRCTSAASAQSRLGETTLTPPRLYHIKKHEEQYSFFFFVNRPHSKILLVIRRYHAASSSAFVQVCIISRLSARAAD